MVPSGQRWNGQKSLCYSVHLIDGALQFGKIVPLTCKVVYEIYKPVLEDAGWNQTAGRIG
jgi:hypothetical protein